MNNRNNILKKNIPAIVPFAPWIVAVQYPSLLSLYSKKLYSYRLNAGLSSWGLWYSSCQCKKSVVLINVAWNHNACSFTLLLHSILVGIACWAHSVWSIRAMNSPFFEKLLWILDHIVMFMSINKKYFCMELQLQITIYGAIFELFWLTWNGSRAEFGSKVLPTYNN